MRKAVLIAAILSVFIFSMQAVCAVSTEMKDNYLAGETIITEVSGNILQAIAAQNVEFRRGHILVPLDYGVSKLGEKHFLWANAPLAAGDYTLIIKDISTTVAGQMKDIDYQRNFSVESNLSNYSVKPGIMLTSSNFEINVQLNVDNNAEVDVQFGEEEEQTKVLKPGENVLKFSIAGVENESLVNLTIGMYSIPVYVRLNSSVRVPVDGISLNLTNLTDVDESDLSDEERSAIDKERAKYYCYEFPGKICKADETCSGQTITSLDGACCVNGDCGAEESGGSLAWIGWLLAAVVVILAIYIWIRYKKVKTDKNPLQKKVISLEKKIP